MGVQHFYGKGPHPLVSASSRAAHGTTINGILHRLHYCVIL